MSFDKANGNLWVGDVGWEAWEMVYKIERGGNYGWSVMEGRQPTNPEWPRGPTPILPPTIEHPHSESSSITDGLTYYGSRLKELHGTHLYGDYDTGKIWAFVMSKERSSTMGIGHFCTASWDSAKTARECYLLDHTAGTIHRLVANRARTGRCISVVERAGF
jgi:hypothetical protein